MKAPGNLWRHFLKLGLDLSQSIHSKTTMLPQLMRCLIMLASHNLIQTSVLRPVSSLRAVVITCQGLRFNSMTRSEMSLRN